MNTCRLCGKWETDRHTGPMYKYSVRHYAHARCGMVRWGRNWLDKQPYWIIKQFPYFLAAELGIVDYLRDRANAEEAKEGLVRRMAIGRQAAAERRKQQG